MAAVFYPDNPLGGVVLVFGPVAEAYTDQINYLNPPFSATEALVRRKRGVGVH